MKVTHFKDATYKRVRRRGLSDIDKDIEAELSGVHPDHMKRFIVLVIIINVVGVTAIGVIWAINYFADKLNNL